jgi:chromosome segregation ATPase
MMFERKLKSSLFGFNKKATIKCIEDVSNEYNDLIKDLKERNKFLEEKFVDLQSKSSQDDEKVLLLSTQKEMLEKQLENSLKNADELEQKMEFVSGAVKEKILQEVEYRNKIDTLEKTIEEIDRRLDIELSKKGPNHVIDEVSSKLSELSVEIKGVKKEYINTANQTVSYIDSLDHSLIRTKVYVEELKQNPPIGRDRDEQVKRELSSIDRLLKMIKK